VPKIEVLEGNEVEAPKVGTLVGKEKAGAKIFFTKSYKNIYFII
jgi:hypothetical protein